MIKYHVLHAIWIHKNVIVFQFVNHDLDSGYVLNLVQYNFFIVVSTLSNTQKVKWLPLMGRFDSLAYDKA